MVNSLFTGKLVRLSAETADDANALAKWTHDAEYQRLLEGRPVRPRTAGSYKTLLEEELPPNFYPFAIRTLEDGKFIGMILLMRIAYNHRHGWVGIGIGDRAYWGKGYGSDAMNVILRFAFQELNLHRVSLDTLGKNARAIRSYEKCGFVHEGELRGAEHRGERDDIVGMGILRDDWLAKQKDT